MNDALVRLSRVTAMMPTAKKNAKSHQHSYLDLSGLLAHVRPVLAVNGLSEVCEVTADEAGRIGCRYIMVGPDDIYETPWAWLPPARDAQSAGGEISYLRRYVLSAACGVDASDDVDAPTKPARAKAKPDSTQLPGVRQVQIALSKAGVRGREERLAYVVKVIGRDVSSSKDLTAEELEQVLYVLHEAGK